MAATDLDLARALLIANKDATLVAVRDDEVITVTERGIKPLLAWVREGRDLTGFSVADKVVGKAPALLYAVLGPDAVFSPDELSSQWYVRLASGELAGEKLTVPNAEAGESGWITAAMTRPELDKLLAGRDVLAVIRVLD